MINILVGLIFEAYGRIRTAAGEPETLLEQVGEAVENLKDRRDDTMTQNENQCNIASNIAGIAWKIDDNCIIIKVHEIVLLLQYMKLIET